MIKFPKLHIAQSVMNRILNLQDELEAGEAEPVSAVSPPSIPEATGAGQALDVALAKPVENVSAPPELAGLPIM